MRIDNTRLGEITQTNTGLDIKGAQAEGKKTSGVSESHRESGRSYAITATQVEKAVRSLQSELDNIKQAAQNIDMDAIKRQMAVLSNTMSGEDFARLSKEGYSLNDTQVKTIVTVMDKIKMELAKGGMDISIFGDNLSMEQLEAITGSTGQAMQMASSLKEFQDGDITYLAGNELEPTIENLYRAQHSGSQNQSGQIQEPVLDDNLKGQIEQVIQEAGFPVNETTMGYGTLLLKHEIPLTPENITYVDKLKNMQIPVENPWAEAAISEAVSEGKQPQEAVLLEGYSLKDRAYTANEVLQNTTEEDISAVLKQNKPFTIQELYWVQRQRGQKEVENQQKPVDSAIFLEENQDYRLVKARRQLEEARLQMTVEANYALLKRGISIETKDLEQLVEDLKGIETSYYKDLLEQNGLEPTEEAADRFQQTIEKTEVLKYLPAYTLGRVIPDETTVNDMVEEGTQVKAQMTQANQAYETMMTAPRADLGDNIQKAFQNVDDILADLNLEPSEANQRVVRILAYNQMEINPESIAGVKSVDEKVQLLFQNLKPVVVMEMIREGINPLEMDVESLNLKAEEIQNRLDPGQEEKYSKYLWKLEQKGELAPEERESYIGIYRLLNQIDKTDGAVIGAVLNQGGELSLKNLLTAVRSKNSRGMEVKADESFGAVDGLTRKGSTISQQIETAYQTDCAKEAFHYLTQEGAEQYMRGSQWQESTPEELLWQLKNQQAAEENEEVYRKEQLQRFALGQKTEESVLRILSQYDMPTDSYHIQAAGAMVSNRNEVFRKLFDRQDLEKRPDLQEAKESILQEFAEALKAPEEMAKAQQKLAETAEHVMETMINEEEVTSIGVQDLKLLRTEIEISTRMSKEEVYAVPVLVADEMTNVQLKIVRGKEKQGKVEVLFETQRYGKAAASIQVTAEKADGYILAEDEELLEKLQQENEFTDSLRGQGERRVQLQYVKGENLDLSGFTFLPEGRKDEDKGGEIYQVQTRELYGVARAFLEMVKQNA